MATAAITTACSDDDNTQSTNPATAAGELRVELVVEGIADAVYRLREARIAVSGPSPTTIRGELPAVMQSLRVGSYRVELLPGWLLERQDQGSYKPVMATLISDAALELTIDEGQTTTVRFRFVAADDRPLGGGDLNVRVGVGDEPPPRPCGLAADFGQLGALRARPVVEDRARGLTATLDEGESLTELSLLLRSDRGAFARGPILPGTYTLQGDELDFATCGVCLVLQGPRSEATGEADSYLATGGTVTITSVLGTLAGTLSNVTFGRMLESPPAPPGCTSRVGSASFSVAIP